MHLSQDPLGGFPIDLLFGWVWFFYGGHSRVSARSIRTTACGLMGVEEMNIPIALHFAELFGRVAIAGLAFPPLLFGVKRWRDALRGFRRLFSRLIASWGAHEVTILHSQSSASSSTAHRPGRVFLAVVVIETILEQRQKTKILVEYPQVPWKPDWENRCVLIPV